MQEEVKENNFKCRKCNIYKNINNFIKDKTRSTGHHPYCKDCQKSIKSKNKTLNIKRASEWNKNNSLKRKEIQKKWNINNKHLTSFYNALRRKRVKNLSDGTLIPENINKLNKNICGICKKSLDWNNPSKIHLDHIIPLSKNGKHSITNVQWTHDKCNLSKNNKIL